MDVIVVLLATAKAHSRVRCGKSLPIEAINMDSTTVGLVWGEIVRPTTAELLGGDGGVGAVGTFEGVTRDSFGQHTVVDLVYEAYEEMALKVLREIVREVRLAFPQLVRVVVLHRLGECPVGQVSVYIACTSAHRQACLQAVPVLLDELKLRAPIWKLERYEGADGAATWKDNRGG